MHIPVPFPQTQKGAPESIALRGPAVLQAHLLVLFPGLLPLFGFGGFIRPLGGVDHRLQQLKLLLDGAVQFVDGTDDKIGVDVRNPPGQFLPAFLGLGIMYNYLDGCAGSHLVHLPFFVIWCILWCSACLICATARFRFAMLLPLFLLAGCVKLSAKFGRNALQLAQQIGVIGFQSVFVHFLFPLCFFALVQFLFQPLLFGG